MSFQTILINHPYDIKSLRLSENRTLTWTCAGGITGFIVCTSSGYAPAATRRLLRQLDGKPYTMLQPGNTLTLNEEAHAYQLRYLQTNSLSFANILDQPPLRYQVFPVVEETAQERLVYISACQANENMLLQRASVQVQCSTLPLLRGYTKCTITSAALPPTEQAEDWLLYYRVAGCPEKIPVPQSMMNTPFFIPAPQKNLSFFINERYNQLIYRRD